MLARPQPDPRWLVPALLVLFAAAAAHSLLRESATYDETAHLPAGLTYLQEGDFRLNPEHPPLSKAWAALPLYLFTDAEPAYDSPAWRGRAPSDRPGGPRTKASEWQFGYELLNGPIGAGERSDPQRLLIPARLAMIIPGVMLGLIVYLWAAELWGQRSATISLFFFALSPTMLAHTRLVTTDLPNALGYALTLWTLWRFCARPTAGRLALHGLALGAALLTKFSALLLLPITVLLLILWIVRGNGDEKSRRLRWSLAIGAAWLLAYGSVWVGYGLRFAAAADPEYLLDWDVVGLRSGPVHAALQTALGWRVAPEAYLYGLAYFLGGSARRLAYLNGQQSLVGWWYYFPEAFLLKTPPATLLLAVTTPVLAVLRRRALSFKGLFLLLPAAVYLAVSIFGNLNIGHRHLAPIYPLLFVALGGLPSLLRGWGRPARVFLAIAMSLAALSFIAATSSYLSYFNRFAGGPVGGARYLLDSNLDWGQDLPRLKSWMDLAGVEQVHLAYFGTADPSAYGIRFKKILLEPDLHPEMPQSRPGSGDWVAVSVNLLFGLYIDTDRALAEGLMRNGWLTGPQLRRWLDLRDDLSLRGRPHPALGDWLEEQRIVPARAIDEVGARMLSTWLTRLRTELDPVDRAGDSIVIYRLP